MFSHLCPLISLSDVTSLPPSRSPSVADVVNNPTDLQCPYGIKLSDKPQGHAEYQSTFLGFWEKIPLISLTEVWLKF